MARDLDELLIKKLGESVATPVSEMEINVGVIKSSFSHW
jgi:hypothetical protein